MESTFNIGPRKIRFTISNLGMRRIYVDESLMYEKWKLLPYGVHEIKIDSKLMSIEIPSRETGSNSAFYDGKLVVEELLPEAVKMANTTTKKLNSFSSLLRPLTILLVVIAVAINVYNNVVV